MLQLSFVYHLLHVFLVAGGRKIDFLLFGNIEGLKLKPNLINAAGVVRLDTTNLDA